MFYGGFVETRHGASLLDGIMPFYETCHGASLLQQRFQYHKKRDVARYVSTAKRRDYAETRHDASLPSPYLRHCFSRPDALLIQSLDWASIERTLSEYWAK